MATNQNTNTDKQPTFTVYTIVEGKNGAKNRWIAIGTAFAHSKGEGFNLILDALPLNFDGRLVARKRTKSEEDTAEGEAQ